MKNNDKRNARNLCHRNCKRTEVRLFEELSCGCDERGDLSRMVPWRNPRLGEVIPSLLFLVVSM